VQPSVSNGLYCTCSKRKGIRTEIRATCIRDSVTDPISNGEIDGPPVVGAIIVELNYAVAEGRHYQT